MSDVMDKDDFVVALKKATTLDLSADEIQKQRVSFVMGSLGKESVATRTFVEDALAKQDGRNRN